MFRELLSLLYGPDESTPVPGRISDEDLERMKFASMQAGDTGRADRIRTVQQMRASELGIPIEEPTLAEAMAEHNRNSGRKQNIGGKFNPFNAVNTALTNRPQ